MKKVLNILLSVVFLYGYNTYAQDYLDTSKIIIKRISALIPFEYNISDTYIKKEKDNPKNFIIRVDLEVPVRTVLKLSVTDSTGEEIMKLIDDQTVNTGVYRIRWEMEEYTPGRYWCEFTTEHFIYRKDFFIK